eukprot:1194887-Prorocentrum_minimum.AAC.3
MGQSSQIICVLNTVLEHSQFAQLATISAKAELDLGCVDSRGTRPSNYIASNPSSVTVVVTAIAGAY